MQDYVQKARRATVGVSALGWIALACLAGSFAFWATLFFDLLAPARLWSPQMIQVLLNTVVFALVLPLFWSMLLPSSPAGRLLQKQQWATPGYAAVVAAALFLTYHSGRWLFTWQSVQPNVRDAGEAAMLTGTSLIGTVLLPALAWCVTTPEQWVAQIEQARHVRRLEHAMRMEEAAMRASYARAVALLNAGISNLTIEQRRELGGILGGFARAQQQALYAIGQSWKEMYGVESLMGGTPDPQIVEQYTQVVSLLAEGGNAMDETAILATLPAPVDRADEETREYIARSNDRHQYAAEPARRAPTVRPGAPAHRPTSGPPVGDRATGRPGDRPSHDAYLAAYATLRGAWKRSELEQALSISKTQALTYIQAWLASGDIIKVDEPRDHYTFTGVN